MSPLRGHNQFQRNTAAGNRVEAVAGPFVQADVGQRDWQADIKRDTQHLHDRASRHPFEDRLDQEFEGHLHAVE